MESVPQFPHVRADNTCPNCSGTKDSGLLLCWPCHHGQKRFNDGAYSADCEMRIAARDADLEFRWCEHLEATFLQRPEIRSGLTEPQIKRRKRGK